MHAANGGEIVSDRSYWISYTISNSSASNTINATWQFYVDGKWIPYSALPVVHMLLQACRKCGTCRPELYQEGKRGHRAPVKTGEPGLCDECYAEFDMWKTQQHGLVPTLPPRKIRTEQKMLGTGDLKLG